jgi:hypothetical protein
MTDIKGIIYSAPFPILVATVANGSMFFNQIFEKFGQKARKIEGVSRPKAGGRRPGVTGHSGQMLPG